MRMSSTDSQLIEQLKWTAEVVASVFGVPAHMLGIGSPPTYNNIEALTGQYYSQCLQIHVENLEKALDEGLNLPPNYGTEFDLDGLIRMDTETKMKVASEGVRSAIFSPNEARWKFDMPAVAGGETPYLQQQLWPIRHLAERPLPTKPLTPPEEIADDGNGDGGPRGGPGDGARATASERVTDIGPWLKKQADRVARRADALRRAP
jgi:hypothetical protein